jgi:hypothetical protein
MAKNSTVEEPVHGHKDAPSSKSDVDLIDPKPRHPVIAAGVLDAVTPFAVAGFDDLTIDPDAVQGSRHFGPILSGDPADGAAGIAMLHKRAKITVAQHGNFSIPVRFPASTILVNYIVQIQQSYNGTLAKINLGNTQNATDIANVDVTVAPTQVYGNFGILGSNWTIWLSQVIGAGGTAGKATVIITYSVPAKTIPS